MKRALLVFSVMVLYLPLFGSGELSLTIDTEGLERKRGLMHFRNQPFTGYTYEMHANGNTKRKTHWIKGQRQGRQISWFANGQIKEIRLYKNNKKDGRHQGWFEDGSPRFEYHFVDGLYHGTYKEWYPDGSIAAAHNFDMGQESGPQKLYELDGQIRANYVVKNGHRYGLVGSKNCITSPTSQL